MGGESMKRFIAILLGTAFLLSACSGKPGRLRDLYDPKAGPEEFAVLPNESLEMPQNLTALPKPTPGGRNLVDPTPKADALAALGGRAGSAKTVTGDAAFVAHVGRYGSDPEIRQTLADEDEKFRKTQARFSRLKLFRVDRYNQAYRFQTLDAYREVQRWRLLGVKTPTMPLD
jgi:hypothetical protein